MILRRQSNLLKFIVENSEIEVEENKKSVERGKEFIEVKRERKNKIGGNFI